MSETVIPETRVHKAPDGGAIVMNQLPAGGARAESPLHHADLARLAADAPALSLIHISEPTRRLMASRMPSSA